jgi:hypothetical protein
VDKDASPETLETTSLDIAVAFWLIDLSISL